MSEYNRSKWLYVFIYIYKYKYIYIYNNIWLIYKLGAPKEIID